MKNNFVSEKIGAPAKTLPYAKCAMPWEHVSWRTVSWSECLGEGLSVCECARLPVCMCVCSCQSVSKA